jgi:hypothetical protein
VQFTSAKEQGETSNQYSETSLMRFLFSSLRIKGFYMFRVGHAVAQLVEALCYKPNGRGFDSRWCHWNFSFT